MSVLIAIALDAVIAVLINWWAHDFDNVVWSESFQIYIVILGLNFIFLLKRSLRIFLSHGLLEVPASIFARKELESLQMPVDRSYYGRVDGMILLRRPGIAREYFRLCMDDPDADRAHVVYAASITALIKSYQVSGFLNSRQIERVCDRAVSSYFEDSRRVNQDLYSSRESVIGTDYRCD